MGLKSLSTARKRIKWDYKENWQQRIERKEDYMGVED